MHSGAYEFVSRVVAGLPRPPATVVEVGARDINGSIREVFTPSAPGALWYCGLDLSPGRGVDVVADGATWQPPAPVECVVSCEVLEHTKAARAIVANAHRMLKPGGVVILTMATDPRPPHSAIDGGGLRLGEYYRNVSEPMLAYWMRAAGWGGFVIDDDTPGDLYCWAIK